MSKVFSNSGIIITKHQGLKGYEYTLTDANYNMCVGRLVYSEGPGWTLTEISSFLDFGHICFLRDFINALYFINDVDI